MIEDYISLFTSLLDNLCTKISSTLPFANSSYILFTLRLLSIHTPSLSLPFSLYGENFQLILGSPALGAVMCNRSYHSLIYLGLHTTWHFFITKDTCDLLSSHPCCCDSHTHFIVQATIAM